MGLLQAGYRTYESQAHMAGVAVEGREMLTPISHMISNAHIEITIGEDGRFIAARPIPKAESKTVIPATEESANRVGDNSRAHPLCDQLRYLADYGGSKYEAYLEQLQSWAASEYSHPKVCAVLAYITGGTILTDLSGAGVVTLDEQGKPQDGKIEGSPYDKCMVRWRVLPAPEDGTASCWEDRTLFAAYAGFYRSMQGDAEQDFCIISGKQDTIAVSHPKGVLAMSYGAKLISANDSSGFTYRGRFVEASQSGAVGYTASQKAHSALRWVAANQGVIMGGRTFLWWNPGGKPLPSVYDFLGMASEQESQTTFVSYKAQLKETLGGYRKALTADDDVVVATLDAATTGRLSVTYYTEIKASDFLERLESWYESCCWDRRGYGIQSPPLRRIVQCAWGTQRGNFIEADDRLLREHIQRLLHCVVDCQPIPTDIVHALAARASQPLAYEKGNRELLLATACAVVRKYKNDRQKKEEWTLALDENNTDRSYRYGRLLAIAEYVERITYSRDEGREPNAIRMQTVFSQRPQYAWRILYESLTPYFKRLYPAKRNECKDMIQEIVEGWSPDSPDLNKKLDDSYLLGYYHQRAALLKKKDANVVTEENENESAE